jgi:hypothetical protein
MTLPDYQMEGKESSMVEFNISYDDVKKLASETFPTWYQAGAIQ